MSNIFPQVSILELGEVFIGVSLFVIMCYGTRLLFLIVNTNRKIENLYRERDEKIEKKTTGSYTTTGVIEAMKKHITEEYDKKIAPLQRRKGYVFDILPLIPKK